MFKKSIIAIALLLAISVPAFAAFTVNSNDDSDDGVCDAVHCSLREALNAANATPGPDTVDFDIAGVGPHTIKPLALLPRIIYTVVIDGYTQPGAAPNSNGVHQGSNALLMIEIDGSATPFPQSLLHFGSAGNTVSGLVINRAPCIALQFVAGDNVVSGNFIGTDPSGTIPLGNAWNPNCGAAAVHISRSSNTMVGGTSPASRNVISANRTGVFINQAPANFVQGNLIGTDASGTLAMGNMFTGIFVQGAPAIGNLIGGTGPGAGNVIADNSSSGILLSDGPTDNVVQGNYIGTDVTGTLALGNTYGIALVTSGNNLVGGVEAGASNLISANARGVQFYGGSLGGNLVQGNLIGTDSSGTLALGNSIGVAIQDSPGEIIGGFLPGSGNIISGNSHGVTISGSGSSGHLIHANTIGRDVSGSHIIGHDIGIDIRNGANSITISGNHISGGGIYGGYSGIYLLDSTNNLIESNTLEQNNTEVSLTRSPGNTVRNNRMYPNYHGIWMHFDAQSNLVEGNLVAGGLNGIRLLDVPAGATIKGNTVVGVENYGIIFHNTSGVMLQENTVRSSTVGIGLWDVSETTVSGNVVTSTFYDGIQMVYSEDILVSGNMFRLSQRDAVRVEHSLDNLFLDNSMETNCIGLALNGESGGNHIVNNNFINNGIQASDQAAPGFTNAFATGLPTGGNYWNDFDQSAEGCDDVLPADGVCDSPYPFTGNMDAYPWTEKDAWLGLGGGQVYDEILFDFCQLQDFDGDGVLDDEDNCPFDANSDQADADNDFIGNVCDPDFDADNDGVPDNADQCLDTPQGGVVDGAGCSISQLCPCAGPGEGWASHGDFVSCVAHAVQDFVSAGLISDNEKGSLVREAAHSSCGK